MAARALGVDHRVLIVKRAEQQAPGDLTLPRLGGLHVLDVANLDDELLGDAPRAEHGPDRATQRRRRPVARLEQFVAQRLGALKHAIQERRQIGRRPGSVAAVPAHDDLTCGQKPAKVGVGVDQLVRRPLSHGKRHRRRGEMVLHGTMNHRVLHGARVVHYAPAGRSPVKVGTPVVIP